MAQHKNLDPAEVRREYLRQGGNVRLTALALDTSRETVYAALRRAEPLVVSTVKLPELEMSQEDASAVAVYVRRMLTKVGILKEPPSTAPHRDSQEGGT